MQLRKEELHTLRLLTELKTADHFHLITMKAIDIYLAAFKAEFSKTFIY